MLDRHRVQEVIIADPDFPEERAVELVDQCHRRGVTVRIAPSTMEILVHRAEFVPGASVPLFELRPPVFDGFDYFVKRSFDFVGALLLIAAAQPAADRDRDRGLRHVARAGPVPLDPAGHRRRAVRLLQVPHDALGRRPAPGRPRVAQRGLRRAVQDPPRPAPDARRALLRRYSLDELPQLFNVVLGQMSLVGPRPLPQRDFDQLEEWHKKRYLVLPGLTGLWQVSGRSELDFDDLVRLDFLYLERWSVGLDLTILLKTIPAVLSRRGAF